MIQSKTNGQKYRRFSDKQSKQIFRDMNTARMSGCAAVVNGKIYAFGGCAHHSTGNLIEWMDPSTGIWTKLCDFPNILSGPASLTDGNKLILFGGWKINGNHCVSTVYTIDVNQEGNSKNIKFEKFLIIFPI